MTRTALITTLAFAGWIQPGSGECMGVQREAGAPGELSDREAAAHVLDRIGYGARPGDVDRVMKMGIDAYLEGQLAPERIDENPDLERYLSGLDALELTGAEIAAEYPMPGRMRRDMRSRGEEIDSVALRRAARASFTPVEQLAQARLARAIFSERQLQEVMVDFWLNHFNVFAPKGPVRSFLVEFEREVIRPNALGDFRTLLGAVARSPAMLFYLDNWMSTAEPGAPRAGDSPIGARRGEGPRRARGLNENYARELLELHTLGVDGGYTQDDVVEVARAFTGWTIDHRSADFLFRPDLHDAGPKLVLGHEITGGTGIEDGERVLDLVARHPSTASFIAHKLAVRFVSDDPPESVVERAAATFRETRGDIREVVRAIITSPEFFSRQAYRSKVKTPFEWVASGVRGLDLEPREMRPLARALRALEMPLYAYQPPTGYPETADAWTGSSALLKRAELASRIGERVARGARLGSAAKGASPPTDHGHANANPVMASTLERLLPAADTDRLASIIAAEVEGKRPREATATAVALVLASPEFQRQ